MFDKQDRNIIIQCLTKHSKLGIVNSAGPKYVINDINFTINNAWNPGETITVTHPVHNGDSSYVYTVESGATSSKQVAAGLVDALSGDGPELGTAGPVALLVDMIRTLRPTLIFAPSIAARHPDHVATAQLVQRAVFFSGVKNYPSSRNDFVNLLK